MLHRLCGPPSIHLSFNLAAGLPGGRLIALAAPLRSQGSQRLSRHRLRRGLPGYLILFAPHAFAPQCQYQSRWSPSPLVFLPISTHFTATRKFHHPLPYSSSVVLDAVPRLSPGISHPTAEPPTRALRPVIPINACTLRITAAAGTKLAGAYSVGNVKTARY